jgi:hypothetical protein
MNNDVAVALAAGRGGTSGIVVALIALFGVLGGVIGTYLGQRLQAGAVTGPTRFSDRAAWQMHKRDVYSKLISAMFQNSQQDLKEPLAQAAFVANSDLRKALLDFISAPELLKEDKRVALINELNADSRAGGGAT